APVVHPGHYGMSGGIGNNQSGGQIRTNMFHTGAHQRWRLRENHLTLACDPLGNCHLRMQPVTVKSDPFPDLFNALRPEGRRPAPAATRSRTTTPTTTSAAETATPT